MSSGELRTLSVATKVFRSIWIEHTCRDELMEPDEYLKTMRTRPPGRAQWGGFPEGVVVAYMLKVEVGFFCEKASQSDAVASKSSKVSLMCDPVKPPSIVGRVCLLWRRTHYDLLTMTAEQWAFSQARQ